MRRFLLTLMIGACASAAVPLGEPFSIEQGKNVAVDGAEVTFDRVSNDSRCPANVTCVWEGDAAVEIRLNGHRLILHTHGGSRYPRSASAAGYEVTLRDLSPAPPYRATLVVNRVP